MDDALDMCAFIFVMVLIAIFVAIIPYKVGRAYGYRDGQIDALSGVKIEYQLRPNERGEQRWQRKAEQPE